MSCWLGKETRLRGSDERRPRGDLFSLQLLYSLLAELIQVRCRSTWRNLAKSNWKPLWNSSIDVKLANALKGAIRSRCVEVLSCGPGEQVSGGRRFRRWCQNRFSGPRPCFVFEFFSLKSIYFHIQDASHAQWIHSRTLQGRCNARSAKQTQRQPAGPAQ